MNDLLARIFDMPARQRALVLVGIVGFLFFVYGYFLYWPRSQEIDDKRADLTRLVADRDRKAKLAANLEEAKKAVEVLKAELKEAVAQLPDTKEIPDLLSSISDAGRASGLEIVQFRQLAESYQDFYAEVPVEILVRGTFFQVEAFLNRVSNLTRIVNVRNMGMKSPDNVDNDPVTLETSCAATTFRFLDEAERERIAKEQAAKKGGKP